MNTKVPGYRLQVSGKQVPGARFQVSGKKSGCFAFLNNLIPRTYHLKPRTYHLKPRTYHLKPKTYNLRRGFTLLLAALISSVVLALGVSIFEIARKQVNLSSIGRESQFAFYAADTGAECALYWDVRWNYFARVDPNIPATCDTQTITIDPSPRPSTDTRTMSFTFEPNGYCSKVTIKKCDNTECANYPNTHTIIRADGYNTNCASVNTSSRALQRSVELRY